MHGRLLSHALHPHPAPLQKNMRFTLFPRFSSLQPALACIAVSILAAAPSKAVATGIIMPIFGNTTAQFDAAVAAAQKVSMIAIINPDEGPGSKKVGGITSQVTRLRSAGATVVGYVATGFGSQSLSSVKAQIDKHVAWYSVSGIFLDEMSDQTSKLSYYRSLYNYAKSKGLKVVGNPGTFVPSGYSAVADVLVTYEDFVSNGWTKQKPSTWTHAFPPSKIAAIVYNVSAAGKKAVMDRAISLKYGWIYVTDGTGDDPFKKASSYLSVEANYIYTMNGYKK